MATKPLQQLLDDSAREAGPAMAASFARDDWRLDAAAFREFWRSTRMFAVSTAAESGQPHIAPVHIQLTDDDELEMAIFENSVRLRDLRQPAHRHYELGGRRPRRYRLRQRERGAGLTP